MPRVQSPISALVMWGSLGWGITVNGIQSGSGPAMAWLESAVVFPFPSWKLLAEKRQTNSIVNFPRIIYSVLLEKEINSLGPYMSPLPAVNSHWNKWVVKKRTWEKSTKFSPLHQCLDDTCASVFYLPHSSRNPWHEHPSAHGLGFLSASHPQSWGSALAC